MVIMPPQQTLGSLAEVHDVPTGGIVITVTREFGAGSDELARRIANAFGVPLLDREILSWAANQAGVSEETVADCERRRGFFEQMFERMALPFSGDYMDPALTTPHSQNFLTNDDYRRMIERVIVQVADEQSAVILGHAGQIVLRDRPEVLKVLVRADMDDRISRVMEQEETGSTAAYQLVLERDRDWSEMFRSAYRVDWMNARCMIWSSTVAASSKRWRYSWC